MVVVLVITVVVVMVVVVVVVVVVVMVVIVVVVVVVVTAAAESMNLPDISVPMKVKFLKLCLNLLKLQISVNCTKYTDNERE